MRNATKLTCIAIALAIVAVSPVSGEGPAWKAKVWTNDGYIWHLNNLLDEGVGGQWEYWAPQESGTLYWDEIDWISFPSNIEPWNYSMPDNEMPRGRRARVHFTNGETRELWVHLRELHGRDAWNVRRIQGEDVTRIDFIGTTVSSVHRCANGHIWQQDGFQYCPYDGLPLEEYPQY